jgi:hypothetical protein
MSMAYVGALEQGWTAQGICITRPKQQRRMAKVEIEQ